MNLQKLKIYISPEASFCSECERRIVKYEDIYIADDRLLCGECLSEYMGPWHEFDEKLADERLEYADWLARGGK